MQVQTSHFCLWWDLVARRTGSGVECTVVNMMSKIGLSQQMMMVFALLAASIASLEAFAPASSMFPGGTPTLKSRQTAFSYIASPNIETTRASSCTPLQVVPSGVTVAAGAITGAITGGLFSGSLHAISGELRMTARCCSRISVNAKVLLESEYVIASAPCVVHGCSS